MLLMRSSTVLGWVLQEVDSETESCVQESIGKTFVRAWGSRTVAEFGLGWPLGEGHSGGGMAHSGCLELSQEDWVFASPTPVAATPLTPMDRRPWERPLPSSKASLWEASVVTCLQPTLSAPESKRVSSLKGNLDWVLCDGPNVCVLPKCICWNPNPQCGGIWKWGFER